MAKQYKLLTKARSAISAGRYSDAISILEKLSLVDPSNTEYLLLLGESLMRNEQFEQATQYFAKVVEKDNQNIRALNNFGAALIRCRHLEDAKRILLYALDLAPDNIDIHINLGTVFQGLAEPEKALRNALKVVELNPSFFLAYNNLGCALGDLMRLDEAREAYKTALALNPKYVPSYINLAQLEIKLGNHNAGIVLYESVLKLPEATNGERELVKYYLGSSYLTLGDLNKGWVNYEYGFSNLLPQGAYRSRRKFTQPKWNGNLLEKAVVLVWREQGLGDEILFSTCLRDLHDSDLNIILECEPRLVDIFKRTYPKFEIRQEYVDINFFSTKNDFEFQIAIGSLPSLFRNNIQSFEKKPKTWLPIPSKFEIFSKKLKAYSEKILVGICWRSGQLSIERNLNYTSIRDWSKLLLNPKYQFVNLVYGDCESELTEVENLLGIKILRWPEFDLKNDLEAVLALISCLDCVVSIGSAASMIAAASGVKTFILLQESWVLLGEKEYYPWFPNVKPFVVKTNEHVGLNIEAIEPFLSKKNG